MSMSDCELLEFAAKASGMPRPVDDNGVWSAWVGPPENGHWWNPLQDDGDALRLAANLGLLVCTNGQGLYAKTIETKHYGYASAPECSEKDHMRLLRRCIVRAAAEIGKAMQEQAK